MSHIRQKFNTPTLASRIKLPHIWWHSALSPEITNNLIVFPNPSDGTVYFKSEGLPGLEEISIFTADGRLMERADDLSGMRQYTMEIPHAGIHFYTILYENGTIDRGKIIIVEKG